MHLQQTKRDSIKTGGAQYYFHELTDSIKTYLRNKGAVEVALVTPYGATKSDYLAVSTNHKLDRNLKPIPGSVGHDRIQQGKANESIGEAIRLWYRLPPGDFEKIGVDVETIEDIFYVTPLTYKYAGRGREKEVPRMDRPLTFTKNYVSELWTRQLALVHRQEPGIVAWSLEEICRVVTDHRKATKMTAVHEVDLLRASGPLKHLGVMLGGYAQRGYDCITKFTFLDYPTYTVPVEIKRNSVGFKYQQSKYGKEELSRAVVLCAIHDHKQIPRNIDVIELDAMCDFAQQFPR
jgi:hypothetical protein